MRIPKRQKLNKRYEERGKVKGGRKMEKKKLEESTIRNEN